jgi:hypothetical protein
MEFIEAPAFTHHLARYLDDEQYRRLQATLATTPELGDVIPVPADSASCAGRTFDGAKAVGVDCG